MNNLSVVLASSIVSALSIFVPNIYAANNDDYTTWDLPEGAIARLGKGLIHDVAFSPGGDMLAVATSIGVWLYSAETLDEVALLSGHTAPVRCVSFSPDGKKIASGSADKTIKMGDVAPKEEIATLAGHKRYVFSISFSPDGKTIASGSDDGAIVIFGL